MQMNTIFPELKDSFHIFLLICVTGSIDRKK